MKRPRELPSGVEGVFGNILARVQGLRSFPLDVMTQVVAFGIQWQGSWKKTLSHWKERGLGRIWPFPLTLTLQCPAAVIALMEG